VPQEGECPGGMGMTASSATRLGPSRTPIARQSEGIDPWRPELGNGGPVNDVAWGAVLLDPCWE